METDPTKIKKRAKEKEDENWEFRAFLKQIDMYPEEIDAIVHRIYEEIASKIDCKACANCCKELLPLLDEEDIEQLSKGLGIPIDQFREQYIVKDEMEGGYTINTMPCPFLENNVCSCGDYRPKNCKSFPHLHKEGFVFKLINVIRYCSVCPIVFNTYERLKDELWHYDFDYDLDDIDLEDFDFVDREYKENA